MGTVPVHHVLPAPRRLLDTGRTRPAQSTAVSCREATTVRSPGYATSLRVRFLVCLVAVVVLAETDDVQQELAQNDIEVQLLREIDPVFSVQPASVFANILQK